MIEGRPGESLEPLDFEQLKRELIEKHETDITEEDVMSAAMYPSVSNQIFATFALHQIIQSSVQCLPSLPLSPSAVSHISNETQLRKIDPA